MSNDFSIYAPQSLWNEWAHKLSLSAEVSKDMSGNTSFLSCVLITVTEENIVVLESESMISTTYIKEEEIDVEGYGQCLIPAQQLSSYIKNMPSDSNVTFSYNYDKEKITIESDSSNHVKFTTNSFGIFNEDALPRAIDHVPEKSSSIVLSGKELPQKFKLASSMTKSLEKDAAAGQDPFSGCSLDITEKGLQMFSLSISSAETFIPSEDIEFHEDNTTVLAAPDITTPRIASFSNDDKIKISIKDSKNIFIENDTTLMSITALNTGNMPNLLSMSVIQQVLEPAWENRVVSVKVPSNEFFKSLSRVSTVKVDKVVLHLTNTIVGIKGIDNGQEIFSQQVPATTDWFDDGDKEIIAEITVSSVRKISSSVSKNDNLIFDVSCKENGDPWTMIVYHGDDYNPQDPHDFFMISLL